MMATALGLAEMFVGVLLPRCWSTDLDFAEEHLDDPVALTAAVDNLLARKPHLASRRPTGEIGQGAAPSTGIGDLAALLRQRAR